MPIIVQTNTLYILMFLSNNECSNFRSLEELQSQIVVLGTFVRKSESIGTEKTNFDTEYKNIV